MKDSKNTKLDSDVNKEDLESLGKKTENLRSDGGDDQILKDREQEVDFEGADLDVPGRTTTENRDPSKAKDEENQLYSQGGDSNENLKN
ncbi:hypothetical protein [Brumimicrobium mesophilum]|uniref:hypothetical protein n=1 Tax=Brumimicrobium mesophilum TaxID=392717 RepID=UPI000D141B1D|nr:hypothetical protein [Brumimicrobium mesophilum]